MDQRSSRKVICGDGGAGTHPPGDWQGCCVEAWGSEEAGLGTKIDSEEDEACKDKGDQEEQRLDCQQHHPVELQQDVSMTVHTMCFCISNVSPNWP